MNPNHLGIELWHLVEATASDAPPEVRLLARSSAYRSGVVNLPPVRVSSGSDARGRSPRLTADAARFAAVGGVGMIVDVGLFNTLRVMSAELPMWLSGPVTASIVSVSCAIVCNWLGNRYWAFRHRRRTDVAIEFAQYLAVSVLGMLVSLACIWVSHYGLGLRGLLADNVAKNVVGLGLGTVVRFILVRSWVWSTGRRALTTATAALDVLPRAVADAAA